MMDVEFSAVGSHQQITALTTSAQNISAAAGANAMWLQPLTNNIRIRLDGVTATATTGFQILAGTVPTQINCGKNVLSLAAETSTAVVEWQSIRV